VNARLLLAILCGALACAAQTGRWSGRGFLENRTLLYPQPGRSDRTQAVDELFLRYESTFRLSDSWLVIGGVDAQTDTHNQVERSWHLSWDDRGLSRPAFALRTASLRYTRGPFRVEAGKQILHWGVMDLFPPTDRFAPRDYLSPSGSDYLGLWAARAVVDTGKLGLELVYAPRFTPSRAPLEGQRWFMLPQLSLFTYRFRGVEYPGGPQLGARFHQVRSPFEYSVCFYQGFDTLPALPSQTNFIRRTVDYRAIYPKIRMLGADFTIPWRGLLWKAESSYIMSPSPYAHNIWTYAVEAEKAWSGLHLSAGYVGEFVTDDRTFSAVPLDRAMRKSFHGAVNYATTRQGIFVEWYLHQSAEAFIARIKYKRKLKGPLEAEAGWNWIEGSNGNPIGRYNVNSYLNLQLRTIF
jgi:hypothetical protein